MCFLITQSCQKSSEKNLSTLRVNICSDPATLDPRKVCDLNSATLNILLYEGLMRQEPDKKKDLGIAESVKISNDGLKYTFTLKKAYWSNGNPITTYDFIQTFKDMLSPTFPCPNAHLLYCIKNAKQAKQGLISHRKIGIRGIDYKSFEIHLESATPYFLDILTFCSLCPVNQNIAQKESSYSPTNSKYLVTNGPYRLVKYTQGQEIILEKNPFYWDKENVSLERIIISIIDNPQTTFNLFEKGKLDFIGQPFTDLPQEVLCQEPHKNKMQNGNLPGSTLLSYNLSSKIFSNINIRKAFALAINRKEFYYSILNITPKDNAISFFSRNLNANHMPHFSLNPQNLKALSYLNKGLQELGLNKKALKNLKLLHSSLGNYAKIAQILQEQWSQNLGVMVKLQTLDHKAFLDKLYCKDYDFSLCCWIAQYLDKMNLFERFIYKDHVKNYPGFNSSEYRNLINEIKYTKNQEEINTIYDKLEDLLVENCPVIPLYHWHNHYMIQNKVQSVKSLPGGSICFKYIKTTNEKAN